MLKTLAMPCKYLPNLLKYNWKYIPHSHRNNSITKKNLNMKILSKTEVSVSFLKTVRTPKVFTPKGDVLSVDAHSMTFTLSTPFFIRN
jgi:hypothetical protein